VTGAVHVVGAGLAGLAAAVELARAGRKVTVYEAAKSAGGRCRSYHDAALGLSIDNGNHLLLSGNRTALSYADAIGGTSALTIGDAQFPFVDVRSGERWTLKPNAGRFPWWIFVPGRRVPGTSLRDYLAPLGILRAREGATIAEAMRCEGTLYDRLWQPLLLAALNTDPKESAAALAAPVLRETLGAGGAACRPVLATGGLSAAFVDPALDTLRRAGATIHTGARLRALQDGNAGRIAALTLADSSVELGSDDQVVLAVPASVAGEVLPDLVVPDDFRSIVNAHFAIAPPSGLPPVTGVVGGLTEWLFAYPDRLSVTISGADRLVDRPREELATTIWAEVARIAGLAPALPRWQIVKEKRATFAATPIQAKRRPGAETAWPNLVLAGDWTDTGLPATIEGSVRSGLVAARLLLGGHGRPLKFV
jgi:squalene-associated FAD-dependent desaturase